MSAPLSHGRLFGLAGLVSAGLLFGGRSARADEDWTDTVGKILGNYYRTGVAVSRIEGKGGYWSAGFGWADLENQVTMTPETILNIASVSKTITATAVMQLWEAGKIDLDASVDKYLPFSVRNPRFPDVVITCRQLLTHRSSVRDGPVYMESYRCGDPEISLADWLASYIRPDGSLYSGADNFHDWRPGTEDPPDDPKPYSNVGFGLLALVVESVADLPFSRYTAENIFQPLGMDHTAWFIDEIDINRHAVPYTPVPEGFDFSEDYPDTANLLFLPRIDDPEPVSPGDLFPHCLYSVPNYSDGVLRTSVSDLSRFLRAMANGGSLNDERILREATIATMFTDQHYGRGLCWKSTTLGGESSRIWYHGGKDPGVMTFLAVRPQDSVGVFVMCNSDDPGPGFAQIIRALFKVKAEGD